MSVLCYRCMIIFVISPDCGRLFSNLMFRSIAYSKNYGYSGDFFQGHFEAFLVSQSTNFRFGLECLDPKTVSWKAL